MTSIHDKERLVPSSEAVGDIGRVTVFHEALQSDREHRPYIRREVGVVDESDADPALRRQYWERADHFEDLLQQFPDWQTTARRDDGLYVDPNNQAAVDLYFEDGHETMMVQWASNMKEAIALEPLQKLEDGGQFLPGGQLDHRTLELFRHMSDGIGLRSRQRIYKDILRQQADTSAETTLHIASLGSGAAVPNIDASLAVEAAGKRIDWRLFELDPRALHYAELLIDDAPIHYSTFDYGPLSTPAHTYKYKGRSYLDIRHAVENDSLDAVDALGLWEYLSDRQAVTFLKTCFKKLKPGAPMVVSNMNRHRPHAEYTRRAVGWPDLYVRTEEELLSIVQAAGIPTDQVRLTIPQDNVYIVMEVYKI